MSNKLKRFFLISAFFSLFFCGYAAQAQSIGIRISPIKIDELVKPGEIIDKTLKVTNDSPSDKTFYVYLNDFEADGESGQAKLVQAGSDEYGLSSWLTITNQGIDFAPGETKEIPFSLKVPDDAAPGGYNGAILVGTEAPKVKVESEDKGAAISTAQRTACLLLFQITGKTSEDAYVREFTTDKEFYGTPFDVKFLLRINNIGNTHIKPQGTISIKNAFGKDAAIIRINEKGSSVLRNSIRKFEESWSGKLAFGRYKAILGLSYGVNTESGGQGKQTLYGEKTFWIIPWKIIVPSILIIAFLISLVAFLLKIYKDRAIKKAMAQIGARKIPYSGKYKKVKLENVSLKLLTIIVLSLLVFLMIYFIFFA